jgi:hypothetical protein
MFILGRLFHAQRLRLNFGRRCIQSAHIEHRVDIKLELPRRWAQTKAKLKAGCAFYMRTRARKEHSCLDPCGGRPKCKFKLVTRVYLECVTLSATGIKNGRAPFNLAAGFVKYGPSKAARRAPKRIPMKQRAQYRAPRFYAEFGKPEVL